MENTTHHAGQNQKSTVLNLCSLRSRYKYILFSDIPFTTKSVINAHKSAFQAIKGCQVEIVWRSVPVIYDLRKPGGYCDVLNIPHYVSQSFFVTYFCRKADPESKGKVENVEISRSIITT
jgi:transposase